jgi:signal transduction histidine kinase
MSSSNYARQFHDIRNSLNVIMGNAQLLLASRSLTAEQQKCTDRIVIAAREILATIKDNSFEAAEITEDELKVNAAVVEKGDPNL